MQTLFRSKVTWSIVAVLVAAIGIFALWSYIFSFQTITFHFNDRQGYVELTGNDNQRLYPVDNQPVKLKKGEYTARNIGKDIEVNERKIVLSSATENIKITFNYTRKYLDELYTREKLSIETALINTYPRISTLYTLTQGKLYHQGEIYGAVLVAREQSSDNADTLRVLMRRQNDEWKVLSKPPTPILSAPVYPEIDRQTLSEINRAK